MTALKQVSRASTSLVEKAKAHTSKKRPNMPISPEVVDVCLAYVRGEIKRAQLCHALEIRQDGLHVYVVLARVFMKLGEEGRIK